MKGIEGMLASMLGIDAKELQDMATRMQTGLLTVAETVVRIEQQNKEILAQFERLTNDKRNGDNCDERGQPGNANDIIGEPSIAE